MVEQLYVKNRPPGTIHDNISINKQPANSLCYSKREHIKEYASDNALFSAAVCVHFTCVLIG